MDKTIKRILKEVLNMDKSHPDYAKTVEALECAWLDGNTAKTPSKKRG